LLRCPDLQDRRANKQKVCLPIQNKAGVAENKEREVKGTQEKAQALRV
jgi:hypothetical protein